MPLQPQEIEIPLTLGMDSRASDELQEPSAMRLVENLHWRETGGIERKPAEASAFTVAAPAGNAYSTSEAYGLVSIGDEPVVVTGGHGLSLYDSANGQQWARRDITSSSNPNSDGALKFCPSNYDVSRRFVASVQSSKEQWGVAQVASAAYNGVHVIAWVAVGDTKYLRLKAIDGDTGRVIATLETIALTGATDHISACEYTQVGKEGVVIAYASATSLAPYTIKCVRYDYATNQFVNESNLTTNAAGNGGIIRFLVKKSGNQLLLAYRDNTSATLKVLTMTMSSLVDSHTATHDFFGGVDIIRGPAPTYHKLIVSTNYDTLYAEVMGYPSDVVTVHTTATDSWWGCTTTFDDRSGGTGHDAVIWVNGIYGVAGAPAGGYTVSCEVNFATPTAITTTSYETVNPHTWAVSRAFTLNGRAHVAMSTGFYQNSTVASRTGVSCVVVRYSGHSTASTRHDPVAKIGHDRFFLRADVNNLDIMTSTYVDSDNNAWITLPADASTATINQGGTAVYYPQTVFQARVSDKRPAPMPYVLPEPGIVCSAGGFPWQFDGETPCELAPIMRPLVSVDVSGGTGNTGTYGIIAVWEFYDAAGRLHRIASAAKSTGAIANKQIDVYVSRCPFTAWDGATAPQLDCKLYITNGSTDVYQLAMTATGRHFYNALSGDMWYKFTDVDPSLGEGVTDAIFTSELSPEPVPSFVHISKISDRLWAVDAEDRSRIWFSKPLVAGYGAGWCVANTLTVGDECTAVVDVGGFPTILARGGIYQIAGSGPDANGTGSFAPAQKMPYEVDCLDPASVCRTPMGVFFRGRRGLYLLGNGLSDAPGLVMDAEMLTDPDEDPSSASMTRCRVVYQQLTNEVHVLTPAGEQLVYNTLEQKWSKYTRTSEVVLDMAVARGRLWKVVRQLGLTDLLRYEKTFASDVASYNEASTGGWSVETPWYRFDQAAGHVRLWRAAVALTNVAGGATADPGDATFTISHYADWDDTTPTTTSTWDGSAFTSLAAGGVSTILQIAPARQLATAHKLVISCSVGDLSSCPKPLSLRLTVGTRPSGGKQSRAETKG